MNKKTFLSLQIKQVIGSPDIKKKIDWDKVDAFIEYQGLTINDLYLVREKVNTIISNEIRKIEAVKKKRLQQENENRRLQNQLEVKKNPSGIVINSKKM